MSKWKQLAADLGVCQRDMATKSDKRCFRTAQSHLAELQANLRNANGRNAELSNRLNLALDETAMAKQAKEAAVKALADVKASLQKAMTEVDANGGRGVGGIVDSFLKTGSLVADVAMGPRF